MCMKFTYESYKRMIELLRTHEYEFAGYHDYEGNEKCVILRHDIDNSIEKAVRLAEIENEIGVRSTYFVLLTSDFYNVASAKSLAGLHRIADLGHEIGLHFDEMAYPEEKCSDVPGLIRHEADILGEILGMNISSVSMHRPSKATLAADYKIPGLVNSYGQTFFHDFKYLSDSRRRWREPVLAIISKEEAQRLHILTHAIWYNDQEETIAETLSKFITAANHERYLTEKDNITDLESILESVQ